jgi:tRNA modification GTPase
LTDTIFALSSAYGKAGVAVFRISGPRAKHALEKLTGRKSFAPNMLFFARIKHPRTDAHIDDAMAVFMKAPKSFTGEDSAEIHTHGGAAVIAAMYDALGSVKGARLATPGEFTRRAFENGKLDLAGVEGVADLIDSETEAQRRAALKRFDGATAKMYKDWRTRLLEILSFAEASIDFSEDELPENIAQTNTQKLQKLAREIAAHLRTAEVSRRIASGLAVAIIGRPNVGKSSLFNRLVGKSRALVSATPGTTRDVLEASLDIGGFKVGLMDTAGLNERPADNIERQGISRARRAARRADVKMFVSDKLAELTAAKPATDTIRILNKIDRRDGAKIPPGIIAVSAKTGRGLARLLSTLEEKVREQTHAPEDAALALTRSKSALETTLKDIRASLREPEHALSAERLRSALRSLGTLTGEVKFSELLDKIFSSFCLGK